MPYQEIDDFTSGQILTTAVMNTLRENVEENRDRQAGAARGYVTTGSFGDAPSSPSSYSNSAVLSITLEFHGRPVMVLLTGGIVFNNARRFFKLGYKVDSGNIIDFTEVPNFPEGDTYWFFTPPPLILTDVPSGEHTISIFLSDAPDSSAARTWRRPGMLVWELPFDSFD